MKDFLQDLRRRRVVRAGIAYVVVAWLAMQVADVAAPALRLPSWTVTLVVFLALLGFPVALVLAWLFDVTPEGLHRTGSDPSGPRQDASLPPPRAYGDAGEQPTPGEAASSGLRNPRVALASGIGVGVVLGLAGLGAMAAFGSDGPGGADPLQSIAVLPFVNRSPDPDNEYFSDGVTEELIDALAQVPGLKVAARTSSFRFKGQSPDVREVGEVLDVEAVLEGSVRKSGDRVRITAQLIASDDGYHLWSETYDRQLTDVFAVQDEIAQSIVDELDVRLAGEESDRLVEEQTSDPEAHALYLRARYAGADRTRQGLERSVRLYQQALTRDSAYAAAWAGLADAYSLMATYRVIPLEDGKASAEQAARRALSIDPEAAEAHATLGGLHAHRHEWAEAEAAFQRALHLKPSYARAHHWYSMLLEILGRREEALDQIRQAEALDPLAPAIVGTRSYLLHFAKDHEAATEKGRESRDLSGTVDDMAWVPVTMAAGGRPDEARRELERTEDHLESHVTRSLNVAATLALLGEEEAALAFLDRMDPEGTATSFARAAVHAAAGRVDSAVHWLERTRMSFNEVFFLSLATFDPVRDDPEFRRFMDDLGLGPRPRS